MSAVAERPRPEIVREILAQGTGYLLRTDLLALGLPRRAVDGFFRACPNVQVPGYSRPMIRVEDYLELRESFTYHGDRVRPC